MLRTVARVLQPMLKLAAKLPAPSLKLGGSGMKKLLLSSVALFGLSTAALAADLPRRQYVAPAPIIAVPVFTWTGFYVGVNAGAAFRDNNRDNPCIDSFGFGFGDCFGGSGLSVQTNAGLAPVVPLTGVSA